MRVTRKLVGHLNRVFSRDPRPFPALTISYLGDSLAWAISDNVLTLTASGGATPGVVGFDLSTLTLATLAAQLQVTPGFIVTGLTSDRSGLSARVLLDGRDASAAAQVTLQGYSSLLWAWMDAVASELTALKVTARAAPSMMDPHTGEGVWLDEVGDLYGVVRLPGEMDRTYGMRIIAEALRPKSNNIAIELAIQTYTGQTASVVDIVSYTTGAPGQAQVHYDGGYNYNGNAYYNGTVATNGKVFPAYGLFDVQVQYDLLNGSSDLNGFAQVITGLVGRMRAAGTHLRALAVSGSSLADAVTPPTDDLALGIGLTIADTAAAPGDAMSNLALGVTLSDVVAAPNDATDALTVLFSTHYDGGRRYDGGSYFSSGQPTTVPISG